MYVKQSSDNEFFTLTYEAEKECSLALRAKTIKMDHDYWTELSPSQDKGFIRPIELSGLLVLIEAHLLEKYGNIIAEMKSDFISGLSIIFKKTF